MGPSINKQKEKEWNNLIKEISKRNGWKFRGWYAYKTVNDFFFDIQFFSSAFNNSITGMFGFKPLSVDDLFWDICDLQDNKKLPLSFRAVGSFTVGSKEVFDFDLKVVPIRLKEDIQILFDSINLQIDSLHSTVINFENFEKYIEQYPSKRSEWFDIDLLIMVNLVLKKYEKALSLLLYAKNKRGMGGWGFGDKDFYDLAIEFCQKQ